jgi:hypothetical protein
MTMPVIDIVSGIGLRARDWTQEETEPQDRLRYRRFIFPEGLSFNGEESGTRTTSPVLGWLRAWERAKGKMVNLRKHG